MKSEREIQTARPGRCPRAALKMFKKYGLRARPEKAAFDDVFREATRVSFKDSPRDGNVETWLDQLWIVCCARSTLVRPEDGAFINDRFFEFLVGQGLALQGEGHEFAMTVSKIFESPETRIENPFGGHCKSNDDANQAGGAL